MHDFNPRSRPQPRQIGIKLSFVYRITLVKKYPSYPPGKHGVKRVHKVLEQGKKGGKTSGQYWGKSGIGKMGGTG